MTEWEPATEAEVAMRDALRANDQELYFRLLSRTDLLLPVSAPALPGQAPSGWGTWTTGGRTHVLAFTSAAALRACLGEHAGSTRRVPFTDLALGWPNHDWWLAVNPGLPVEGYLPAWFVSQLSRGDVRLPGRAMGARARLERAETLARTRAGATGRDAAPVTGPVPSGSEPTVTLSGRSAQTGAVPPGPGASTRTPDPGELSRRSGVDDMPNAGQRHPTDPPRPARHGEVSVPGTSRYAALTPPDQPVVVPNDPSAPGRAWPPASRPAADTDGPAAANGSAQDGRRSFFEPTSGRGRPPGPTSGDVRSGDRAAPPSRFSRGSQPFPRRRPADDDGATRAFPMPPPNTARPPRPPAGDLGAPRGVRAPAANEELTQPLPPRRPDPLAQEPTRAFRVPGPAAGEPPLARPAPSADETQAIQRGRPVDPRRFEPAEELPPTIAEPVSGPLGSRRGFTPIVIEGTIVESRDLTDVTEADAPVEAPRRPDPAPAPPSFGAFAPDPAPFGPAAPDSAPPDAPAPDPSLFGATAPDSAPAPASDPSLFDAPPSFRTTSSDAGLFEPAATGPILFAPADAGQGAGGSSVDAGQDAGGVSVDADLGGSRADQRVGAPDDRADLGVPPVGMSGAGWTGGPETDADRIGDADVDATPHRPLVGSGPETARTDADAADSGERTVADGQRPPADGPAPVEFEPANTVEEDLLNAAGAGSTDTFLSTLLLARVLLPAAPDSARGSRPGDPGFVWRTAQLDGETYVVVYTSPERLADHAEGDVDTVRVKFAQLIRRWPDEDWSFAVNPGTPVGAKLPGEQIVALANWAAEVGLGDDLEVDPQEPAAVEEPTARPRYAPAAVDPTRPTVMQKAIAPSQLAYYLERGYDRVSGFVHRAGELAHLTTPAQLHDALGLSYPESPFVRDAEEIYVLRWPAHRPSLYRIPYGGQNEAAMRAMEGWVIERPPFRGNGFAPGESSDVVAEFKVDSVRLPHGAQLWRIGGDGTERVVAVLDTDAVVWRRVGEA
ncbi:SseB family protein [Micromonospora sp. NPDC047527]|uniref:SseB family protein n=1 Tax=Micromonospora sp. NPDC047527 TaxID=3155144 RepID=UPI0033CE5C8D